MKRSLSVVVVVCLAGLAAPAQAQPTSIERIFVSQDQVPGKAPGVTFGFCPNNNFALNDRGEAAFVWCFGSGGSFDGLFLRDAGGGFTIVAETGQDAPGVTGGVFVGTFDRLVFNDVGDIMFTALLEIGPGGVDSSNNLGIWYYHGGTLLLVGREGFQAPGTAPGELFTSNPQPLLGRRGGAGFTWAARDPGGPLAAPPGLWSVDTGGGVDLVVREGEPAPGFEEGLTVGNFNGRRVIGPGRFAYGASVAVAPGLTAIWEEDDTTIEVRIAGGDPVPGTGGAVTFSSPDGIRGVNFASEMAFRTGLDNSPIGGTALVTDDDGGDPVLVAIQNDVAPGAGGATFNSLATIPFVVNGQGEIAFAAGVSGGLNGLWTNAGGTLRKVALQGDPAPGFSGDFESFFVSSAQGLNLNDRGESIFYGRVNNQLHLFHAAPDGTLSLIFERDQDFEISPGDTRTLTGFLVHEGEDAHDLPRRSLNTAGQLLVRLSFDNSTRSGLWLSGIPAPLTDPISYAALGDSYSSGEGAPPYFAGTDDPNNKCHRSTRAYSTQLRTPGNSRSLYELAVTEPGFEWDFLACSGAESDNVRSAGEGIYDELPQLDPSNNVDASRDLVTISIGGNDAFFSWILMLCLVHESCHTWEPFEPLTELTFEELFPLLASYAKVKAGEVHVEVRAATPNAPTVVVGYPQVLGGRECLNVGVPPVSLTADEQAFMRSATSMLNTRLAESAAEVGVHFVPAESHFAGHGACGTQGDWIHGLLPYTPVSSFHPKVRGQIEFGRLINDYFEDLHLQGWAPGFFATDLPRNPDPMPLAPLAGTDGTTPTLGPLDVVADPAAPCSTDAYVPGQTVRVSGTGFAASESVAVRVKLANQVASIALGSLTADGSGEIDDIVTLPAAVVTPTFATIEALGSGSTAAGHLGVALIRLEDSFSTDTDTDGIPDICDVCPDLSSPDQTDTDGDGTGDLCDACPQEFENDADGDGLCAAVDPCPSDVENDADNDGRCASEDNCPLVFNPAQVDTDGDGRGDLCAFGLCHVVDVTVRPAVGGEVRFASSNCGLDTYFEGSPLSFEVVPDLAGYHFTGWTGDVDTTTHPLALSVDGPLQITANFCTDPTDGDGDLIGDPCDNCPVDINADQIDGDGDLVGDACDCAPADSGVFAAPGEIADVAVLADKETIAWTSMALTAGSTTVYDVVRGDLGAFPVGAGAETCIATATSTANAQDASTPAAGTGFYYVVRAINSCGTGTFGEASGGAERDTTICP